MPYRDDQASLEARRDELRADLAEVTVKTDALTEAVRSKEALGRELAAVEERLRRVASRSLPLLESIRIASPCNADWDHMVGDDQVRFCGSCAKNVYNLSAMARDEAESLLAKHEGSLCVRLYRRADGTVLTSDCPVGVRKKRVKRLLVAAAGAGALAAAASGAFATQGDMGRPVTMGEPGERAFIPPVLTSEPAAPPTMGSAAPVPSAAPLPLMGRLPVQQKPKMGKPMMGDI